VSNQSDTTVTNFSIGSAAISVSSSPIIITSPTSVFNPGGSQQINLVWVWGAATDTFTLQDSHGNTLLVGIGTTGQTTGMWACPFAIPCVGGYQVTSITVSGSGALYVFNGT
jgi:hypothetical protein